MSRRLSGEATWLVECRVNLSEIERRSKRHPKGNCLYKHPGIFIRMTVTHKDQSSLSRVVPSSLAHKHAHTPVNSFSSHLSLSLCSSISVYLFAYLSLLIESTHTGARPATEREEGTCLNVYLAAKNTHSPRMLGQRLCRPRSL